MTITNHNRPSGPVLLSGFEPFGGESMNASEQVVRHLQGTVIEEHPIRGVILPCVFDAATEVLRQHLRATQPSLVVCLGQAVGHSAITPERTAVNWADARIPDNAGKQPTGRLLEPHGPQSYRSTLPVDAIIRALQEHGIPAEPSDNAGTFVCNHVFYGLMHYLDQQSGANRIRGGFIHLPVLPQQNPQGPSLPLESLVTGTCLALATALQP